MDNDEIAEIMKRGQEALDAWAATKSQPAKSDAPAQPDVKTSSSPLNREQMSGYTGSSLERFYEKCREDYLENRRIRREQERRAVADLTIKPKPPVTAPPPKPAVWPGTARSFGEHVIDLFNRGKIKANSRTDALKQWCPRYVQKNGAPMNPRAILQSLLNKRDSENPTKH